MTQHTNKENNMPYNSSMPKEYTYGSQVVSTRSIHADGSIIKTGVKGIIINTLMPVKGSIRVHFETGQVMDLYFPEAVLEVVVQQQFEA